MPCSWLLRMSGLSLCCATAIWGEESLTIAPGRVPYLGEAVGHVVVSTAPDRMDEALTLQVATDAGKVLGVGRVVSGQRSAVEIPLAGLAEGTTVLRCRLLAAGREVAIADTRLIKLRPKPHAVQIDNRRRGLMVDGLPFFPFGFVSIPPGRPEGDASIPPDLAAQGFNLYSPYSSGSNAAGLEHIRAWMDRCAEVGVKVNYDIRWDCFTGSRDAGWTPEAWQALRTVVEGLRDHPALLSWYIADEPYDKHLEQLVAMRRFVKELDPYHPVAIVFFEGPALLQRPEWREVTDVAWLDMYPVNLPSRDQRGNPYWQAAPPEARRGVGSMAAYWLKRMDRKFAYSMPLWYAPQCFGGGYEWSSQQREPSAQELRAMVYAGLVSGATAMMCWPYMPRVYPTSPRLWAEAGRLAQETLELTPFLLSEEPRRAVTASSPAVLTAGWQDRGMTLAVALNTENTPTSLEVTLRDSRYSGPAEVLFENREIEVGSGVIKDTIEAQGTRVYQIPKGPFPADRAALAPGNIRLNPSFEEWVNAGSLADASIKRGIGCTCFLDARTAVHGRHSLRLTASGTEGLELRFNFVGQYGVFEGAKIKPGGRYRASLWAKADRPGLGLRLALSRTDRADGEQFLLSTKWQEYSMVVTVKGAQADGEILMGPGLKFEGPGTAWVDLFQVVPTE